MAGRPALDARRKICHRVAGGHHRTNPHRSRRSAQSRSRIIRISHDLIINGELDSLAVADIVGYGDLELEERAGHCLEGCLEGLPASNWRRRFIDAGIELLLPEVCATCGISGRWICRECSETVRVADQSQACKRCGHPAGLGDVACTRCCDWAHPTPEVRSVYEFSGALRDSILRMKYHGEYARAEWHGMEMARLASELEWAPDILVPVPLHPSRLRQRGYNQSQKLAEAMGTALTLQVVGGVLRNRETLQQTTLGVDQRRLNVAGAFSATMSLGGARVLLVDDVTTTRSTLLECAAACWDAGSASVQALTLATDV